MAMKAEEKRVQNAAIRFVRANIMHAIQDAEYETQRVHSDVRVRLSASASYDDAHAALVRAELELMDAVIALDGTVVTP